MTLLKVLGPDRESIHGGTWTWEPGVWTPATEPVLCQSGWHLVRPWDLPEWWRLDCTVWEAEGRGLCDDGGGKFAWSSARILRRLRTPALPELVGYAADCAERMLVHVPAGERRPARAITAARAWTTCPCEQHVHAAADAAAAASATARATYATYAYAASATARATYAAAAYAASATARATYANADAAAAFVASAASNAAADAAAAAAYVAYVASAASNATAAANATANAATNATTTANATNDFGAGGCAVRARRLTLGVAHEPGKLHVQRRDLVGLLHRLRQRRVLGGRREHARGCGDRASDIPFTAGLVSGFGRPSVHQHMLLAPGASDGSRNAPASTGPGSSSAAEKSTCERLRL